MSQASTNSGIHPYMKFGYTGTPEIQATFNEIYAAAAKRRENGEPKVLTGKFNKS